MIHKLVLKKLSFCLLIILLVVTVALPQDTVIRIEGEVVAFDKLGSLTQLSHIPPRQLFLVKVKKLIKGKESQAYLFILQQDFDQKTSLFQSIDKKRYGFKVRLKREPNCDSTVRNADTFNSVDQSGTSHVASRLEWLKKEVEISLDTKIPCYSFSGKNYKEIDN